MKLNIAERLLVLNLLPKEGTYANVKELRKAWEIIALTQEDLAAVNFKPNTEQYDQQKAMERYVDLPLSEWVTHTIQGVLVKKELEAKLPTAMMSIYEKFVIDHE